MIATNATESTTAPGVWVLADVRAGNRSQCLGVADALGRDYVIKELDYGPLAALPNALLGAGFAGLTARSKSQLTPPWPDLVIAAGRRTAPVARRIGRLAGPACRLVQVMHPGAGAGEFSLVAQPGHDTPRPGANVITVTGAPHPLSEERLEQAAERWRGRFDDLHKPRIALVVGGSTRRRQFTGAMARELGARASKMALQAGGSLLVTTSARTGAAAEELIGAISAPAHVHRWGIDAENPYEGYIALADGVIVTGDSASMCSEACASTGPVYIYAPPALTVAKHARLHRELFDQGFARPLDGPFEAWTHPRLDAAAEIAAAIRDRLGAG